jgi:glyoxylase-like metal-dependent hydrolase (beta-lactamase superfamily II)
VAGAGQRIQPPLNAGFYREQFIKQWKPADFVKPSEAMAWVGLKPEEVTDLIVSHMHWDHAGGIDLFPRRKPGFRWTNRNIMPVRRAWPGSGSPRYW